LIRGKLNCREMKTAVCSIVISPVGFVSGCKKKWQIVHAGLKSPADAASALL
jgi:hypothetical protein